MANSKQIALEKALENLDEEELRDIAYKLENLSASTEAEEKRPETDDELHEWFKKSVGINIPRVAATPDTNAPFEWVSDLFFGREDSALVIGSRGSGKSFLAALLIFAICYWFKDIECMTLGAIEIQAKRVYSHVKSFQMKAEEKLGDNKVKSSQMSETHYKTGAKYEVVTSSLSAVNGPHSQFVHRDEVELMDREVYKESLNIEKSKKLDSGETLKTRTLLTSTRKRSDGLMQSLIDDCLKAEKEGRKPPFKIYNTNIYDVIENQPNCRAANPDLPEEEKCNCNQVVSGEWEPGKARTFEDCCGGVLNKADGFTPIEDAHNIFAKSPKALWEAQQENKRPYTEDVSYPLFAKQRHGIKNFEIDPANGPIFCGLDVGGTNPHAVGWAQLLEYEIEVDGHNGTLKRIPEGSLVLFGELYVSEIGIVELAEKIIEKEKIWLSFDKNFRVQGRFMDPQAKSAKLDLKNNKPPLDFTKWPAMTRDREVHFTRLRERINDDLFFVDTENCPMFCEEIEVYNFKNKDFDHMHDAVAYLNSNLYALLKKGKQGTGVPTYKDKASLEHPDQFSAKIPSVRKKSMLGQRSESIDNWRESLLVQRNKFNR
jgi:hypothetical protein